MGNCACDVEAECPRLDAQPTHLFLEVTPECNSACPGCGAMVSRRTSAPPLDLRQWRTILDHLAPLSPRLRITGGEPTLHPQFAQILEYAEDLALPYTVFTNGRWGAPDALIRALASKKHLEGILVSIHGAGAVSHEAFTCTPGSFDEALTNVRRAAAAGVSIVTSTVITRHNFGEVSGIVDLARSIPAVRATFSRYIGPPLPEVEATASQLAIAVRTLEGLARQWGDNGRPFVHFGSPVPRCFTGNHSRSCLAGFAHATIDPWANLRPCSHVGLAAGNLLDQSIEELWASPIMEVWRRRLLAQCDGCAVIGTCRSACLAQAWYSEMERDPLIYMATHQTVKATNNRRADIHCAGQHVF